MLTDHSEVKNYNTLTIDLAFRRRIKEEKGMFHSVTNTSFMSAVRGYISLNTSEGPERPPGGGGPPGVVVDIYPLTA